MDVVVQWVRTSWTKQSRGGTAAASRNALAVGFELPDVPRPFMHEISMREADAFRPASSVHPLTGDVRSVRLREADGRLLVQPLIPALFTLPPRRRRPPAIRLAPGQWLRWQLNYRFSSAAGMADWSYHLHTLNVAYGPAEREVFLGTPTRYVDERGSLR
ncbi:hypothetical protein GCM10010156_37560 [Planobispora rosea]|uniref:Uncharacterized protein n=1 Tax=Planobispora rosea TaxID=35762 RepID=A0A8J3RX59_PLARO|nr:hypothetical protein [Planobispora rosea]GGS75229.1 hypothetical protein GCM10010156_37560 [Planobispora rosea]GIH81831.1 hypothetical protein Pro02_02390 [Planobispora rosea]